VSGTSTGGVFCGNLPFLPTFFILLHRDHTVNSNLALVGMQPEAGGRHRCRSGRPSKAAPRRTKKSHGRGVVNGRAEDLDHSGAVGGEAVG
jgi:hypothetical protein